MTKRIYFITWLPILMVINLIGQDQSILLMSNQDSSNVNLLDNGRVIPLKEYTFSQDVFHAVIDTSTNRLYLRTREVNKKGKRYKPSGFITSIDLATSKMEWQDRINYNKSLSNIKHRYLIRKKPTKDIMVDLVTGRELWEVKNNIYYMFDKQNIAIGYRTKGINEKAKELQGLDMTTGAVVWEREIDRTYGWREMFATSDSTLIISGSGIHSLNCLDGKGWSIDYKAGKDKINFWTGKTRYFNLGSNIIQDTTEQMMYQANETIIKFNEQGEIQWQSELPVEKLSKMFLLHDDTSLFLINTGGANEANLGYGHIGKPYFAIIYKDSGTIKKMKPIALEKKEYIYNVRFARDSMISILTTKQLLALDLQTGETLLRMPLNNERFGKTRRLSGHTAHKKVGDTFKLLSDQFEHVIWNGDEKSYHFISNEWRINSYPQEDLYYKVKITDSLFLYYGIDRPSYLSDEEDNILGMINSLYRPSIAGTLLLSVKDKQLFIHDLGEYMDDQN